MLIQVNVPQPHVPAANNSVRGSSNVSLSVEYSELVIDIFVSVYYVNYFDLLGGCASTNGTEQRWTQCKCKIQCL